VRELTKFRNLPTLSDRQWLKCRPGGTIEAACTDQVYAASLHCADSNKSTAAIYGIETDSNNVDCNTSVTVHWSPVTCVKAAKYTDVFCYQKNSINSQRPIF